MSGLDHLNNFVLCFTIYLKNLKDVVIAKVTILKFPIPMLVTTASTALEDAQNAHIIIYVF